MNENAPGWHWEPASPNHADYGNSNQWTVKAGMHSLARESAQNTNDAVLQDHDGELVYTLIRLAGSAREEFLEAAGWATLGEHLSAMTSAAGAAVAAGQIKGGLSQVKDSESLLLMRIEDYGCAGLTGPEMLAHDLAEEDYGNFIKLCRTDLFSGKDKAAGGSFGLGKAVYWRFSRLQTVLFNSRPSDTPDRTRLFGVNQGVVHGTGVQRFQGRGFFGNAGEESGFAAPVVRSHWDDTDLARRLLISRTSSRPGTTALLVGFYNPDDPDLGLAGGDELVRLAHDLVGGIEESFWPLITRGRLVVRVGVEDDGQTLLDQVVDPSDTYKELVRALTRYDVGDIADVLDEPESIVVRDIPIEISERIDEIDPHPTFTHTAKLVVTLSDDEKDSLENRVCLFRKAEMVVETIDKEFESTKYHAFLLAGVAVDPANPTQELARADDFLRFAEPPPHDRWIPGTGRSEVAQTNLQPHYKAPWRKNLEDIRTGVLAALYEMFDAAPPPQASNVETVLRYLTFLRGKGPGPGPGPSAGRKPSVRIQKAEVVDGFWSVAFEIEAQNRGHGWRVDPTIRLAGLDRRGLTVDWEKLEVVSGGTFEDGQIVMPTIPNKRKIKAVVRGRTGSDLPIPADESGIEVLVSRAQIIEEDADK